jgi:hypothetical protein
MPASVVTVMRRSTCRLQLGQTTGVRGYFDLLLGIRDCCFEAKVEHLGIERAAIAQHRRQNTSRRAQQFDLTVLWDRSPLEPSDRAANASLWAAATSSAASARSWAEPMETVSVTLVRLSPSNEKNETRLMMGEPARGTNELRLSAARRSSEALNRTLENHLVRAVAVLAFAGKSTSCEDQLPATVPDAVHLTRKVLILNALDSIFPPRANSIGNQHRRDLQQRDHAKQHSDHTKLDSRHRSKSDGASGVTANRSAQRFVAVEMADVETARLPQLELEIISGVAAT